MLFPHLDIFDLLDVLLNVLGNYKSVEIKEIPAFQLYRKYIIT